MRWVGLLVATLLVVADAGAAELSEEDKAAARRAYEAGVAATKSGDLKAAAQAFATADAIIPNATALESALEASLRADDAALGMELVDRAERRPAVTFPAVVARARATFEGRAGRLIVTCVEPCGLLVDGAVAPRTTLWLTVGAHVVRAEGATPPQERTVEVKANATNEVDLRPVQVVAPVSPPTPAPTPSVRSVDEPDEGGFAASPALFFIGVGVTAALGGVAVWSFVDTGSVHEDFETRSAAYDGSRSERAELEALAADGEGAATRSWVFVGGAAAAAVGTTLIGILVTDWGGSEAQAGVGLSPAGASLHARF